MDGRKDHEGNPWSEKEQLSRAWGILLFGFIGAAATILAVGHVRRTVDLFNIELKWQSTSSRNSSHGTKRGDTWERFKRQMQEEYELKMERVERIRRMQNMFNRERDRHRRGYERWRENASGPYQQSPQDDWYWNTDTSYQHQRTNFKSPQWDNNSYSMSHHYSVLGLDRSRKTPYSDTEIKAAFRAKAMQYHPDQNQNNKEAAAAKFKEVMASYDAIKLERKNRC
ncbi:putative DnaJ domain, Chaperone J-domain superfamily [Dioscorea sansibarensis]